MAARASETQMPPTATTTSIAAHPAIERPLAPIPTFYPLPTRYGPKTELYPSNEFGRVKVREIFHIVREKTRPPHGGRVLYLPLAS